MSAAILASMASRASSSSLVLLDLGVPPCYAALDQARSPALLAPQSARRISPLQARLLSWILTSLKSWTLTSPKSWYLTSLQARSCLKRLACVPAGDSESSGSWLVTVRCVGPSCCLGVLMNSSSTEMVESVDGGWD